MTETALHPKQLEAQQRKAKAQQESRERKTEIDAARSRDIRFVNFAPDAFDKAMTVAYRADRRDVIEVATAIQHPNDEYSKEIGTYIAAVNFALGKTVLLRKPSGIPAGSFVKRTFGAMRRTYLPVDYHNLY